MMMIFGGQNDAKRRAIDEAFEAQQAILRRRRNPRARDAYFKDVEKKRDAETDVWYDKLAWQKRTDDKNFNKVSNLRAAMPRAREGLGRRLHLRSVRVTQRRCALPPPVARRTARRVQAAAGGRQSQKAWIRGPAANQGPVEPPAPDGVLWRRR